MTAVEVAAPAGFRVRRHQRVEVIGAEVFELEHATGATLVHFATADPHLRFEIAFRTVPTDATGAPHILEHCVLYAPSRHHPVPAYASRTLRTGRGAWTGWDFTTYRFSSIHRESFLELIDSFCDSMLEPVLDEEVFRYQAHRLEFEDPDDAGTPLRIRGVIYNEQKGIFGLPVYRSWTAVLAALFPGTSYAVEHGGSPDRIPDITLEQLRDFHRRHYHPSSAVVLTWGDVALEDVAARLGAALDRVEERAFEIPEYLPTPRLDAPVREVAGLPVAAGGESSGNIVQVAWALGPVSDQRRAVLREVADVLLMGPAGILRRHLVASGLGTGVHETYDRIVRLRMREMVLAFGLEGVEPGAEDRVEQAVLECLGRVVSEGFDPAALEAALHSIEFARRELDANAGSGELDPGSIFIGTVLPAISAGADIFAALDIGAELERIRAEAAAGGRPVEDFVRTALLDNPHRATVVLVPDPGAEARLGAEEDARLAAAAAAMDEAGRAALVESNRRLQATLAERQRSGIEGGFQVRPPLPAADPEALRLELGEHRGAAYVVPTGGITHLDLVFDLAGLPADLWDDVALFARALVRSGLRDLDPERTNALIGATTGGLEAGVRLDLAADGERFQPTLTVSGRALRRRQHELCALIAGLVAAGSTGDDVVRAAVADAAAAAELNVHAHAADYLRRLAGSRLRRSLELADRMEGFAALARLRSLAAAPTGQVGPSGGLRERFERIRAHLRAVAPVEAVVAASDEEALAAITGPLGDALAGFEASSGPGSLPDRLSAPAGLGEARVSPSASACNARAWAVPAEGHPDAPALQVAANLATAGHMAPEVMRKGTAYSGQVEYRGSEGVVVAWSIRDPHVVRTQRVFEELPRWLADAPIDTAVLDVARLTAGILAAMPEAPATRARRAWSEARRGLAPDGRRRRAALAAEVALEDIRRVAREHLRTAGVGAALAPAGLLLDAAGLFDATRPA